MSSVSHRELSAEERFKQRNLSWLARRRIIARVLFVVLSLIAVAVLAFAFWVHTVE